MKNNKVEERGVLKRKGGLRGFNKHQRPTKCVGYFFFCRMKEQLVSIML